MQSKKRIQRARGGRLLAGAITAWLGFGLSAGAYTFVSSNNIDYAGSSSDAIHLQNTKVGEGSLTGELLLTDGNGAAPACFGSYGITNSCYWILGAEDPGRSLSRIDIWMSDNGTRHLYRFQIAVSSNGTDYVTVADSGNGLVPSTDNNTTNLARFVFDPNEVPGVRCVKLLADVPSVSYAVCFREIDIFTSGEASSCTVSNNIAFGGVATDAINQQVSVIATGSYSSTTYIRDLTDGARAANGCFTTVGTNAAVWVLGADMPTRRLTGMDIWMKDDGSRSRYRFQAAVSSNGSDYTIVGDTGYRFLPASNTDTNNLCRLTFDNSAPTLGV
ncbi:MAG: hypothetical protein PHR35_02660, partial [Kiritimatiellae bacterium]|nr:hypothetical protein [Kiritimatiellia bacterium]